MSVADVMIGLAALGAALAAGVAIHRCRTDASRTWALLAFTAGVAAAIAVVAIAAEWLRQPQNPWNAARLAPAVSLLHGYTLYYPLHEGPILSTVVGPVAFLFYSPVAPLFGRPTSLILAGAALNIVLWLGLAGLLARRIAADTTSAVLAGLVLVHLVLLHPALRYSLFCIHSDAPALLLGGVGTGLVIFGSAPLSWRRCTAAGLVLALAVWAKQSLAPIVILAAVIVALHHGRTALRRFIVAAVVAGLVVSLVFVAWFGFAPLRDNLLAVPAAHPWQQMDLTTGQVYPHLPATGVAARAKVLVAASLHLVRANWPLWALLVAALLLHATRREGAMPWWPRRPWAAFLLLALGLMPMAALGRVKIGGEFNHESLVVLFLSVAVVCWLADLAGTGGRNHRIALASALAVLVLVNAPRALDYGGWTAAWANQNEMAYQYERAHPGRVYFPWNPLGPLLARGQLHHFDYGVFDRNLGGARVTAEHIRAHTPGAEPIIARFIAHHDYILRTYFPHYRERPADPELPGWQLYGPAERAATQ